jgi:tripartite-type tricarboxylate transporter receptor subunit TctC
MFVVNPSSPYKTLNDVAEDAKRDPQSFTWASQGGAATADYIMRKFARLAGFDITKTKPVTVRSQTEITTMAAGNQIKVGVVVIAAAQAAIQGNLIRPLALSASARSPNLPNVPTTAELGFPIDLPVWTGISGPPKLPAAIVAKWNAALQEMVKDPSVVAQLAKIGSVPRYLNAADFRQYVVREAGEVEELYR